MAILNSLDDTIMALATPNGMGALAIIRISGQDAIVNVQKIFRSKGGQTLGTATSHTVHFGQIIDGDEIVDEVLVSLFRAPRSFTGENSIEISCHGSLFIQQRILELLGRNGCRTARPGEYSMRAFLNRKMDLSQAEAVADLIASSSEAARKVAMNQMRGGFSTELKALRQALLHFASLMELELDFSEEDVEFADRAELRSLLNGSAESINRLIGSFKLGNVIKNGIQVAIIGEPNVGKSTLLNALLDEDRAIVSDIAGTTRDTIEDRMAIDGILFRFIDTAGIRETTDAIETLGIARTIAKTHQADIVLFMFDASACSLEQIRTEVANLSKGQPDLDHRLMIVFNKSDKHNGSQQLQLDRWQTVTISAKHGTGLDSLKSELVAHVNTDRLKEDQTIVTNARHIEALRHTRDALLDAMDGLDKQIPGDLITIDVRKALFHLGQITGEVTTDDLLNNMFSNFCIGK